MAIYGKNDIDQTMGVRFNSYSDRPGTDGTSRQLPNAPTQQAAPVSPRTAGRPQPTPPTAPKPIGSNPADMSVRAQQARMSGDVTAQYAANDPSAQAQLSRMTAQPQPVEAQPDPAQLGVAQRAVSPRLAGPQPIQTPPVNLAPAPQPRNSILDQLAGEQAAQDNQRFSFNTTPVDQAPSVRSGFTFNPMWYN